MGFINVSCVYPTKIEAKKISDILLKNNLISGYQIIKIDSTYKWKQEIKTKDEYLVYMKSTIILYKKIEEEIKKYHSYDICEICCFPIMNGEPGFLKWIEEETKL